MEPGADIQRYVLTGPEIARGLPQQFLHFFFRVAIPDETSGAVALVTQTIGPPAGESPTIPLIFDIDAFLNVDFPPESEQVWEIISVLRKFKNRIFFRSLTAESLEAFR